MNLSRIMQIVALCSLSASTGAQAVQEDRFVGSGVDTDDGFGGSVAIDGPVSVVGAFWDGSEEAAFVFRQSGTNWAQEAKFTHPTGSSSTEFGSAVDVSGSVVVVGSPSDDGVVDTTGAAYVYRFDGAGWNLEATLIQADGDTNDHFARSVAVDGDVIICSARGGPTSPTTSGTTRTLPTVCT